MSTKFVVITTVFAIAAHSAVAQEKPTIIELPVTTETEIEKLLGAPLERDVVPASAATLSETAETESLFVIEGGSAKSAEEWSASDSKACKDSGGVELPISAGRIACFSL